MLDNPSLTLAIALAVGLVVQALAIHVRLPGLVMLLAAGVALGPDGANVVRPELLGASLKALVNFAVAVILFDGGLGLDLKRLNREGRAIRQLITVGALVTALGGTVAARFILGWNWRISALFGTLIIVTGPTVITPLLRRLQVKHTVSTILEAEGVLIDAVGAIVAAVTLEIVLQPTGERMVSGLMQVAIRLGVGGLMGAVGGLIIAGPLRVRNLIPNGMENVFTLGMVLFIFQAAESLLHGESGISAAITAGIVVRNLGTHMDRELREFKEQLTTMLIGMLFVLLAADVRVQEITELGAGAWFVVIAVIAVIRPLNILVGTWGTPLTAKERVFLSWIGPRGIVAAAAASFFASELAEAGVDGSGLRALVFLVIATTVLWAGLTGGAVASLLGLRRKTNDGWVILGTNKLARTVSHLLSEQEQSVVCLESNSSAAKIAEKDGLKVVFGNALETRTLQLTRVDSREGVLGLTTNENTNILFLEFVKRQTPQPKLLAALETWSTGVTESMVSRLGADVLFGAAVDVSRWSRRLEEGSAAVQWWKATATVKGTDILSPDKAHTLCVPLVTRRKKQNVPVAHGITLAKEQELALAVDTRRPEEVEAFLESKKLQRVS